VQVYGALTKAFSRSGDWRRALEVLELMQAEGVQPNAQVSSGAAWALAGDELAATDGLVSRLLPCSHACMLVCVWQHPWCTTSAD
jgi:pentatricopeptide repeat protein